MNLRITFLHSHLIFPYLTPKNIYDVFPFTYSLFFSNFFKPRNSCSSKFSCGGLLFRVLASDSSSVSPFCFDLLREEVSLLADSDWLAKAMSPKHSELAADNESSVVILRPPFFREVFSWLWDFVSKVFKLVISVAFWGPLRAWKWEVHLIIHQNS